jgi:hypothetical protein
MEMDKAPYLASLLGVLVLLSVTWCLATRQIRTRRLPLWRATMEVLGLFAGSLSFLIYLVILAHAYLISTGRLPRVDLISVYRRFAPLELGASSLILGLFGKGLPRIAIATLGAIVALLWIWYAAASR